MSLGPSLDRPLPAKYRPGMSIGAGVVQNLPSNAYETRGDSTAEGSRDLLHSYQPAQEHTGGNSNT